MESEFQRQVCGVERDETEVEVVPTIRRTVGVADEKSAVYHDAADINPYCSQPLTTYSNSIVRLEIMNPWPGFTARELNS